MGLSPSPTVCQGYLSYYEYSMLERLGKLSNADCWLQLFEHWFRQIDDLLVINNPWIKQFLFPKGERTDDNPFWLYPACVNVEETTESSIHITIFGHELSFGIKTIFLDISFQIVNNKIVYKRYDKTEKLNFEPVRYVCLD